jgi:hypothetical protein
VPAGLKSKSLHKWLVHCTPLVPDAGASRISAQIGGSIDMPIRDAKYFLERAEHCFRLARCITDRDTTAKLQALGRNFMNTAADIDAEREAENRPAGTS